MNTADRIRQGLQMGAARAALVWERLRSGVTFNPLDPRLYSDPYPLYRRLREEDPVHWSPLTRAWILTRYDDVLGVLRSPDFSADDRKSPGFDRQLRRLKKQGVLPDDQEFEPSMLRTDPPDHTRLRKLVSKAFTPRAISQLAPRIETIVCEQLDAVADTGTMDVIGQLAYPLPVLVIAEMIGVPGSDRDRFKHWSTDAVANMGFASIDDNRRALRASQELRAYFVEICEQRRREPRDYLMSALLAAEDEGDRLSNAEVFGTLNLLLIAGNETTTNLIGNGMLALLRNPEQLEHLRDDPERIDTAIDELLRYDGPVQATSRIATQETRFADGTVAAGEQVIIVLGAANRDPARFAEPDRLDLERQDNQHLAFGNGLHFCLGSNLARLEARHAIKAMVERFPNMKLAIDVPSWRHNMILHGLEALPVRF